MSDDGERGYTADEMMAVAAARRLDDGTVCFVGIGLPSLAANLARATHAPGCVLVYERHDRGEADAPAAVDRRRRAGRDRRLGRLDPRDLRVLAPGGRIDVGFLGAAQIDRFGNLNSTVIGDYDRPRVRLPGGGGAPEIAASCRETYVMLRQTPRAFVPELDFLTTVGHRPREGAGEKLAFPGAGVTCVITDLGILQPDPGTTELTLVDLHPGATVEEARAATGWDLRVAEDVRVGEPPTEAELGERLAPDLVERGADGRRPEGDGADRRRALKYSSSPQKPGKATQRGEPCGDRLDRRRAGCRGASARRRGRARRRRPAAAARPAGRSRSPGPAGRPARTRAGPARSSSRASRAPRRRSDARRAARSPPTAGSRRSSAALRPTSTGRFWFVSTTFTTSQSPSCDCQIAPGGRNG